MLQFAQRLDAVSEITGRTVAWLLPLMTLITCVVVIVRYVFNANSIALQESIMYLHGSVFMLALAYALKNGAHVRVDVLSQRFSPRLRHSVEIAGTTFFLLPFATFMLYTSINYVWFSWSVLESSSQPGGLPGVYLLKSVIPVSAALLMLQAVAELIRHTQALRKVAV